MFLVSVLLIITLLQVAVPEEYTNEFQVDIDGVLKNERLLKNYYECIIGRGKCTPEGNELKKDIPDALENECAKCNDQQKEGARKAIRFIYKNKPEWWRELEEKFDPTGVYKKKYQKYIENELLSR